MRWRARLRWRARRGAIVVLLGIMAVTLMSISAISIDFSRLWALRNELQTSADAAAHAGALQLLPPNLAANAIQVATSYAAANNAMQGSVTVDSVIEGDWDDASRTFTPGAPVDAISVTVSRQSTGLMMSLLGVAQPRIKARAIGWADAPVNNSSGCIKPVAVPFDALMSRINNYRGIANTPDTNGLYRPFDQVADMAALSAMSTTLRTFALKFGTGTISDTLGQISGSYQAVQLGEKWDVSTGLPASPGPVGGANAFKDNMAGGTCYSLQVGDSLLTQSGLGDGQPAICGAWPGAQGCGGANSINGPGICSVIRGDQQDPQSIDQSSSRFGDCEDGSGNVGIDMKAAFYRCSSGCTGQSTVEVSLLGSFTLMKVYPDNPKNNPTPYNPNFSKAEIVGIFKPITDVGTVGPGSTTLVRPIIVR
jgi:hypothetical protein